MPLGSRVLFWLPLLAVRASSYCNIHNDMLGPLYLPGAPFRDGGVVCAPGPSDRVLTITGNVLSSDCGGTVAHAVLDIWQCSSENDGKSYYGCSGCSGDISKWPHASFYCRGKVVADARGAFKFKTVRPGRYDDRPIEHIHVKVVHEETEHVTQLYFADDEKSASMPSNVRLEVGPDYSASVDIVTPFAATTSTPSSSPTAAPSSAASPAPSADHPFKTSTLSSATTPTPSRSVASCTSQRSRSPALAFFIASLLFNKMLHL